MAVLETCSACGTRYAVGLAACPHCRTVLAPEPSTFGALDSAHETADEKPGEGEEAQGDA